MLPPKPSTRGEFDELSNAQLEEESRDADRQQIDRDADHDLVSAIADRRDGVNQSRTPVRRKCRQRTPIHGLPV